MRRVVIFLLFVFSVAPTGSKEPGWRSPPGHATSISELRSWVDANRGFGFPQSVDAELIGLHVFITWNCPFSGRDGTFVNAYRREVGSNTWVMVDSSFFERPEPLSHAYVDGRTGQVVYVGRSGHVLKKIAVAETRFK